MVTRSGEVYRLVDAATIRATAHSWPDSEPWPDLGNAAQMRGWLRAAWRRPGLAAAVWTASPEFAARVDAACSDGRLEADRGRRMVLALARYLVRGRGRATPFGLFAGVAPVRFGEAVSVTRAGQPELRLRPSAAWLASIVALLEANPAVRQHLLVQTNNMAVTRGARIVVTRRPHCSVQAGSPSVRNTAAVQLAVKLAAGPVPWTDVVAAVAAAFPQSRSMAAEALVAELVSHGVLISSLRPPSTCPDPLKYVLDQLDAADGGSREQSAVHGHLRSIRERLGAAEIEASQIREAADRMRGLRNVAQPLAVDLHLADRIVLPRQVAAEVVAAVGVLRRLTPDPTGRPQWRRYRARFVHRYGTTAVVPLMQLLNPVTGLGLPEHFTATSNRSDGHHLGRDERLLMLAQQALIDGTREVVLDDAAVTALADPGTAGGNLSPHLDIVAEVRAASVAALTRGEFTVALTGMGRSAMATSGRFLGMLSVTERERMCREFATLPVAVDGAVAVQLSFAPHSLDAQNVLVAGQVLPWLLPLAEHHSHSATIDLDDLGVTAGHDRLVLVSLSQRRVVEPTIAHAAAVHTMPPVGRFLLEVSRGMDARLTPFDWGAASGLPFRPGLRYGRTLVTAARWRIDPAALPSGQATDTQWQAAWETLRAKLRLPTWVQIGSGDKRLRLNLDHRMDLALVRTHLDSAAGPCTLVDAAGPADFGWLAGRAHEVVVPVACTAAPAAPPASISERASWPPPEPGPPSLPGSDGLICASLRIEPSTMEDVLLDALPRLIATWSEPPMMWFLRGRRPASHLRLRLHTDDYGFAAVTIGQWAADLRRRGLAGDLRLETYQPESGRYGDGRAMAAAERLFAADSTAALAQLHAHTEHRIHRRALTAASMIDLASAVLGTRSDACEWLITHPQAPGRASLDRDVLRYAVALDAADFPKRVSAAWQQRREAAKQYAAILSASGGPLSPASVLESLLHLHYVRTHNPDETAEQVTYRLARHIALATARRRVGKTGASA